MSKKEINKLVSITNKIFKYKTCHVTQNVQSEASVSHNILLCTTHIIINPVTTPVSYKKV